MTSKPRLLAEPMPRGSLNFTSPALLAGLVLFPMSCPALAGDNVVTSDQVAELTAGLFCAPPMAGRRDAPGTVFGWVHVPDVPVDLIAEGQIAPAVLGLGFGVRFTLHQETNAVLSYTVTHPPMPPRGVTEQNWTGTMDAGAADTMFFQFDTPDELQPGDWSFSVSQDGAYLLTVEFTVVPAAAAPGLAHLCRGGALLSAIPSPPGAAG